MTHNLLKKLSKRELFRLLKMEASFQYPTELAVNIVDELRSRNIMVKTNPVFDEAREKYNKKNKKETK